MEKVIRLIGEIHEQLQIEKRKEEVKDVFIKTFGMEPVWTGISSGHAVARRVVDVDDLKNVKAYHCIKELARNFEDIRDVSAITIEIEENPYPQGYKEWQFNVDREYDSVTIYCEKEVDKYKVRIVVHAKKELY